MHANVACIIKNMNVIRDVTRNGIDGVNYTPKDCLFVSEGRQLNHCYTALKIPSDKASFIQEHDASLQTDEEMLDKMMLNSQLTESIAFGIYPRDPMGTIIDKDWLIYRMENDGFKDLLVKHDLLSTYIAAVGHAEAKNMSEYLDAITHIYTTIQNAPSTIESIRSLLRKPIENHGIFSATAEALTELARLRESSIIARVEDFVRKNPHIKIVVIIFGQTHCDRLISLINDSCFLFLDKSRSSRNISGGKHKTKKRSHKKRRSRRV